MAIFLSCNNHKFFQETYCKTYKFCVIYFAHFKREQLRAVGEAKGCTLIHLEELTEIANNHIARIEGGRYNVTLDTIAILAAALDAEVKHFDGQGKFSVVKIVIRSGASVMM